MSLPGQSSGGFRLRDVKQSTFNGTVAQDLSTLAAAVQTSNQTIKQQAEFMADMSARLDGHGALLDQQHGKNADFDARLQYLVSFQLGSSFRQRLRWLVFGKRP